MKRFLYFVILIGLFWFIGSPILAEENNEALKFFKKYVNAANSYSSNILEMYSPNAKIIRQVLKPDGELVDVETDTETYLRQMKLGSKVARLRQYKNYYSNITSTKIDDGYKISAMRQPSGEKYKLPFYMVIKKQSNGQWKIVEELMQTKVQTFLKYAKR
jgi:hypothetical protein